MAIPVATGARTARVIVIGNEKGGSGKSTVAMHVAVALLKAGKRVATIDLDPRQKSFTSYIENRRAWAEQVGRALELPEHISLGERVNFPSTDDQAAGSKVLTDTIEEFAENHDFIVIDTAGHDSYLTRLAHAKADILITPLNDSFVDFDVLASVDPNTYKITSTGPYAQMVTEARSQRQILDHFTPDWIVLRNRLNAVRSRNKRFVGEGLRELSEKLNFRCVDGLGDRVVFRELFPRGLTAIDDLDEAMLGARPTMSHMTARLEIEALIAAMHLDGEADATEHVDSEKRDAA